VARKSRGRTRKTKKVQLLPADYRFPGESGPYWTGMAGVFILFAWIVAMFLFLAKTPAQTIRWQWIYLFVWPVAAVFIANYLSAKPRLAQIKRAGRQTRVMSNNRPDLFALLLKQSEMLGFPKTPSLYVVEDDAPFVYSIPSKGGSVIASETVIKELSQEEFGALLARELGSLRARNVRLSLAMRWVRSSNPIMKVLFLPVFLFTFLTGAWSDVVEYTADRAAILITGSESLVNIALVKLLILQDPQAEIDSADLEAYIGGSTDISVDSAQLERHYRIGGFIDSQPNLKERIEQIREYRPSAQGQEAFAKLAQLGGPGA